MIGMECDVSIVGMDKQSMEARAATPMVSSRELTITFDSAPSSANEKFRENAAGRVGDYETKRRVRSSYPV
jgi:hypothetical protein